MNNLALGLLIGMVLGAIAAFLFIKADWRNTVRDCPVCLSKIRQPRHGLRRAFCPTCHATLPHALSLHLDRALRSRWFVAWWRSAMAILRRNQEMQAISHRTTRKPIATALPDVSTSRRQGGPTQKEKVS